MLQARSSVDWHQVPLSVMVPLFRIIGIVTTWKKWASNLIEI
jgi:hypothetical protein